MKNSLFTDFSTSFTAAEFTFTTFAVRETIVWPKHTDTNTTSARWALSFWWENGSRVCNTKRNLLELNACMMIIVSGYHWLLGWIKKPLSSSGHCYRAAYEADVYSIATQNIIYSFCLEDVGQSVLIRWKIMIVCWRWAISLYIS